MPPVSKAQARFLFSQKPKIAKKWQAEGAMSTKGLPERVGKPAAGPKPIGMPRVKVKLP